MLNKLKSKIRFNARVEKPLQRTLNLILSYFEHDDTQEVVDLRNTLASLVKNIFGDNELTLDDQNAIQHLLRDYSPRESKKIFETLQEAKSIEVSDAVPILNRIEKKEREEIFQEYLTLALSSGRFFENEKFFEELGEGLGISEEEYCNLRDEYVKKDVRRRQIIRSGAGIAVALIVLLVFIVTATLLRSVIFGLILAYIMLPLEKFFERKLGNPNSIVYKSFALLDKVFYPLKALSRKIRRTPGYSLTEEEKEKRDRKILITRAVSATSFVLFVIALIISIFIVGSSFRYLSRIKFSHESSDDKAPKVVQAEVISSNNDDIPLDTTHVTNEVTSKVTSKKADIPGTTLSALESMFAPVLSSLDRVRERFDNVPIVKSILSEISLTLNDEKAQRELIKMALDRTGGFFAFTGRLIGHMVTFLLDFLLTIFFFLLILTKIAEFSHGKKENAFSEYLVRTVFSGNWLPGTTEETVAEAEKIISEVINKLKTWLRGYLTLVLIDTTVYTTAFWLLKVPYFFILGPIAGCGVLLPYIGPIASTILTVLVTLAVSGAEASTLQIVAILIVYLIHNGIVEQFILYPVVIGESLGLTTLETIIVVLLGAIFAGITGMLLALPAASVLKYLVPQIYHWFDGKRHLTRSKSAD